MIRFSQSSAPGAGHFELGHVREIEQPNRIAHTLALIRHRLPPVRLSIGQAVASLSTLWRKPCRVLTAKPGAKHRPGLGLAVIDWVLSLWSGGIKALVRKDLLGPVFIEIPGHFLGVFLVRPIAEPRHIPVEDVNFRLAPDDPFRDHPTDPRALIEPRHHPISAEIVAQGRVRTDQRTQIRRKDHRAIDHPLHARFGKAGHDLDRFLEIPFHAGQIVGQELMPEIRRCAILGPVPHLVLIGPKQQPHAFLPRIAPGFIVVDLRQLKAKVFDQRDGFRHQIMVFRPASAAVPPRPSGPPRGPKGPPR